MWTIYALVHGPQYECGPCLIVGKELCAHLRIVPCVLSEDFKKQSSQHQRKATGLSGLLLNRQVVSVVIIHTAQANPSHTFLAG